MRVAVVGAGIVGLATAVALADHDVTVTVYESGVAGNGQSGGSGRIFRHAHDDARLVVHARRSLRLWRRWEERFATTLVSSDGAVVVGPAAHRRFATLEQAGVTAARLVDGARVPDVLPVSAGYEQPALVDPSAGAIDTRTAIAALVRVLGPRLVADEVHAVATAPTGGVEVIAGGTTARFDRAVISAGRGSAPLAAGLGRALPVTVTAHVRLTFAVAGAAPPRLACLQDATGQYGGVSAYATAQPGNETYAVGLSWPIAVTATGAIADTDAVARACRDTRAYVRRALPGLDPEPRGSRTCWITRLPWGDDGVAAWQEGDVLIVAGHNMFKLAPWIGTEVAAAIVGDRACAALDPTLALGRV